MRIFECTNCGAAGLFRQHGLRPLRYATGLRPACLRHRAIEIEEPSHDHLCANARSTRPVTGWWLTGDDEQFCLAVAGH